MQGFRRVLRVARTFHWPELGPLASADSTGSWAVPSCCLLEERRADSDGQLVASAPSVGFFLQPWKQASPGLAVRLVMIRTAPKSVVWGVNSLSGVFVAETLRLKSPGFCNSERLLHLKRLCHAFLSRRGDGCLVWLGRGQGARAKKDSLG